MAACPPVLRAYQGINPFSQIAYFICVALHDYNKILAVLQSLHYIPTTPPVSVCVRVRERVCVYSSIYV